MNIFFIFLFDRPLPPKMANQFMLHDRETAFCFKASVCELLGDEYLISWSLSARMHLSGTAMDITISPLSHTWLTYCPLRLPARPPPTHPVDGCNVTLKKTIFRNHTQAPGGGYRYNGTVRGALTITFWAQKNGVEKVVAMVTYYTLHAHVYTWYWGIQECITKSV